MTNITISSNSGKSYTYTINLKNQSAYKTISYYNTETQKKETYDFTKGGKVSDNMLEKFWEALCNLMGLDGNDKDLSDNDISTALQKQCKGPNEESVKTGYWHQQEEEPENLEYHSNQKETFSISINA